MSARLPEFDLLFEMKRFLEVLPEFRDSGIVLIQSHKPMPGTMELAKMNDESRHRVLRQNGMILEFYLPHVYEVASLTCTEKRIVGNIMSRFVNSV